MDLEEVALECALEGNDTLNQKWVGVLEVQVHDNHHAHAHQLRPEGLLELGGIVGVDGGRDELALLGGAHGGGLDVLQGSHIWYKK